MSGGPGDAADARPGANLGPTDNEAELTKVGGARAIGLALAVGRNATWPTLAWSVPGLAWVLDRVYGVVAENRRRLPGATPWCAAHPDECAPAAP